MREREGFRPPLETEDETLEKRSKMPPVEIISKFDAGTRKLQKELDELEKAEATVENTSKMATLYTQIQERKNPGQREKEIQGKIDRNKLEIDRLEQKKTRKNRKAVEKTQETRRQSIEILTREWRKAKAERIEEYLREQAEGEKLAA